MKAAMAARNVTLKEHSRFIENSKLEKEQVQKLAFGQSPSSAKFDKLVGEVGMYVDDEDDISKMEPEQVRQKLSAYHQALGLTKRKFEETGGHDPEVLELAKRHTPTKERAERVADSTVQGMDATQTGKQGHAQHLHEQRHVSVRQSGGFLRAHGRQI